MLMNLTPQAQITRRLMLSLTCALAMAPSVWSQTKDTTSAAAPADDTKKVPVENTKKLEDEKLVLSPFVVTTAKDSGYYAENTLAGSRLNSNLADLAASITVVTKQQMEDTAALDINDVFKYEANTEGSSTYTPLITDRGTAKDAVSGYSFGNDGSSSTNATANRVRGLSAPDAAINYFPTNSRIPFDSYNTQSVEIARGPNSLLFGLGSPSGIVNQSAAQAVLNRDTNSVSFRTDAYGSYRSSVAINRSLIDNKLAVYMAFLYNNTQFQRKPSYDLTRREYAAITYKPFKKTTIRAFAEGYNNNANRPNFVTPRDFVTPWLQAGRPAYDPIARTITRLDTGTVYGPYVSTTLSPGYVPGTLTGTAALTNTLSAFWVQGIQFDDTSRPLQRIDNGTVVDFFQRNPNLYAPAQTNPATATPTPNSLGWLANDPRYAVIDRLWTSSNALFNPLAVMDGKTYTQASFQVKGITDKSIYDWTKYNTNQANFGRTKAGNYNIELEQQVLENLFFSAGWFRQDIDSADNYTISQTNGATVQIDTNTKLINGTANPYFGLPFLVDSAPDTFYVPETDDNFRAMLAYDLDFTRHSGWTKWLGKHRLLGLVSEQSVKKEQQRFRNVFVSADADGTLRYLPNLTLNGTNYTGASLKRNYYLASPGDAQGKISHSTGFYGNLGWEVPYTTQIQVYNYTTGQFQNDQVTEQATFFNGSSFKSQRDVKSWNLAAQSYLWNDRLVSTIGWRHDDYKARVTTPGALTDVNGVTTEPALANDRLFLNKVNGLYDVNTIMNRWNHYDKLSGDTKTLGAAFRPFKDWGFLDRRASQGSYVADFVRNLTFYYNQSDNFNPPSTFQTDYFRKPLPKPTGNGKDGGIGFNMLNNKLVVRINWFTTESQNERTSAASTLLTRAAYSDTTTGTYWAATVVRIRHGANTAVTNWNTDAVNNVSDAASVKEIWDLLKLPVNYYSGLSIGGTQQSKARGTEVQVTYNPTNNWTMKFTAGKQETIYNSIAPEFDAWVATRMPVWTTQMVAPEIADFTDVAGRRYSLKNFWTGYGFTSVAFVENTDGNTSPQAYYANVVTSQIALAKALEGAVAPNQRRYSASFLTNYVFNKGKLKGFSVGGSQRYASRAAVGFLGKAADPTLPTVLNASDVTKPVYFDNGIYNTDVWAAYTRKIFRDKVRMKVQLNCNNITEDGHLQPISVNFDGTPWAYRIIDSRQFVLTTSFDF
jgi:hypothetical protein